ncbi:transcription factor DIVARICATA isoform X2 [Phoenix dactylifera]|uniref:Transcription factor MYBS1 n=1 Tax=Phoenix dactylifera TaxID=42345 RepID=A0A8B7BE74_PHODC|nr:transcription factor DIVARICATA isoform X2 [Phoenix dactylifera]
MVTSSWMEVLAQTTPYFPNSSWLLGPKRSGNWTQEENKLFEDALAHFDGDTPDRWEMVAAMIPGKSVQDIISHYKDLEEDVSHIEAGLIPFPGYSSSSFTLDWENSHRYEGSKPSYFVGAKRLGGRPDQERKKGVPWTEEEHKLFLLGLQKYGKGDWRNISRNFVHTRTPTQVASHAQKYFIRLNSGGRDKRRSSIHDITTVSLPNNGPPSPSQSSLLSLQSSSAANTATSDQFSVIGDSNQPNEAASVFSPSSHEFSILRYRAQECSSNKALA